MNEYSSRINRVIDYIDTHLGEDLSLDELASIANFSKFHFNRIFHALTGESLFTFIQRLRLEKAAGLLAGRPDMNVTEIALECGFSGSASFSKSFRSFFDTSPSQWRKEKSMYVERAENSNLGKPNRKLSKDNEVSGNVGLMYLEGGKYACAQFRLGEKDYADAWRWVYSVWFPASGFLPDDRPAFELFPREGEKATDGKHRVDICVSVLPAR